ncbi:MAG: hypothetical protein RLZZ144_682 [Pseudomonadota bacterium]|jgi:glutamyl-Q tRNA(Asp) synthetase
MTSSTIYRGRFAPSPTGPLHFGSLVAAVGSYLEAKSQHGVWLVRMEDLDTPRCVSGAAADILATLAIFGMVSDEPVLLQSQRAAAYEIALLQLQEIDAVYPCNCSRKAIAEVASLGIEGPIYPGTCRNNNLADSNRASSWRVKTNHLCRHSQADGNPAFRNGAEIIYFEDRLQGLTQQDIEAEIGDFVVKRADGLFAYQLAVVVDDAFQGITDVVRGCDLLTSTARQIALQNLLNLPTPRYAHLPIAVNAVGEKLSKQTLANPVDTTHPVSTLWQVLSFLQQHPPLSLRQQSLTDVWRWALENWRIENLIGLRSLPAVADKFANSR